MNNIFIIPIFLIVPVLLASWKLEGKDKSTFSLILLVTGAALFLLLGYIDSIYTYAGGGDDQNYYENSLGQFKSWTDWFDFSRITNQEQAGYSLLLTWIGQFFGDNLYARKALNLSVFLCLPVIWYLIGFQLSGRKLACVLFISVLFCTPLWFYWMFLLKDMTIVLLQSLFLLGASRYLSGTKLVASAVLMLVSTILLIPFRVYLVVINVGVLVIGIIFSLIRKGKIGNKLGQSVLVLVTISLLLIIATNKNTLQNLGVRGETRGLDSASIQQNLNLYEKSAKYRVQVDASYYVKLPILFIIGETSGFNPNSWKRPTAKSVRGGLATPWILFAVPFLVIGIWNYIMTYLKSSKRIVSFANNQIEYRRYRTVALEAIFAFLAAYFILSLITVDTTRWRMPAMPAMMLFFALGWLQISAMRKLIIVFAWMFSLFVVLIGFYFVL